MYVTQKPLIFAHFPIILKCIFIRFLKKILKYIFNSEKFRENTKYCFLFKYF